MPDLSLERETGGIVAGIDEAGRGPLAGPVVAAAVVLDARALPEALAARINDSKLLPRAEREEIFAALRTCCRMAVGAASVAEIERLNILEATMLAMARAVVRLGLCPDVALVDGNRAPRLPCPARTVVGGDGICLSIAAASIVAKVTRDKLMLRLAQRYPGFGWETNVGYSTPQHFAGLDRLGPTRHHRRTFEPIVKMLNQKTY